MKKLLSNNLVKRIFNAKTFSLVFFLAVIAYFLFSVNTISEETLNRKEASLNDALNRAIVSCYCVEGTYPPSLDYLISHYGIIYDRDNFFIDYQAIGSNIYPDVTVIRREAR